MALPSFLMFHSEADSIQAHQQLQGTLHQIDKMVTAQHVTAQRLGADGVLPALVAILQWSMCSQRDIVAYAASLAEYLREGISAEVELAIPAELAEDLTTVLANAKDLLTRLTEMATSSTPEAETKLLEDAKVLLPQLSDAIEAVAAATEETEKDEGEEPILAESDEESLLEDEEGAK